MKIKNKKIRSSEILVIFGPEMRRRILNTRAHDFRWVDPQNEAHEMTLVSSSQGCRWPVSSEVCVNILWWVSVLSVGPPCGVHKGAGGQSVVRCVSTISSEECPKAFIQGYSRAGQSCSGVCVYLGYEVPLPSCTKQTCVWVWVCGLLLVTRVLSHEG